MTKIMLVEDDNNLREIYEARLSAEGYDIVSAENGEAALAMAAKERPDMIISDVMMPKISGFEMLDILRNTNSLKNVKIIMLTALGQAEDSQRADSLGADRYLVKSQVTLEDIVKAAHDLLDDPSTMANVPTLPTNEAPAPANPVSDTPEAATTPEQVADAVPIAVPADAAPVAPIEVAPAESAAEPADTEAQPEPAAETESAFTPTPASVIEPTDPVEPTPAVSDDAVAAEPAATDDSTPQVTPSDTSGAVFASDPAAAPSEPVNTTTDTSVQPATDDQSAASANTSVISIPVSDGGTDDTATPSPLNVVEPPAEPETPASDMTLPVVEPPIEAVEQSDATQPTSEVSAPEVSPETPLEPAAPDYTSPDNFNAFQTPEAASEPASEVAAEPAAEQFSPEPVSQPDSQSEAPSVEIPSVVSNPDTTGSSDLFSDTPAVSGPADPVPSPEELGGDMAPVISAPEGESVAAPEPTSVTDAPEPTTNSDVVTPESEFKDEQLREVAEDLAQSVSDENTTQIAASDSNSRSKGAVVTPISSDNKPNLDQLLAVEEAKNGAQQAAQATEPARPNVDAYAPSTAPAPQTPDTNEDPNSIAL
jgi:CheY-like chemotaxis protein